MMWNYPVQVRPTFRGQQGREWCFRNRISSGCNGQSPKPAALFSEIARHFA
jgi:hypothetical protein